jgi:non-ribosomal peptide synthetase component F
LGSAVTSGAIHRLVEQQAALRASAVAIADGNRSITYRDLNFAANSMARRLMTHGFRRGAHATVTGPVGIDLAIVLLAVLKMGGTYIWNDPASFQPASMSLSFATGTSSSESRHLHLDLAAALAEPVVCSPNLPIVTRASDIACVMPDGEGVPVVKVPHATITALRPQDLPKPAAWSADPGAFDLWIALMAGTTAVVETQAAAAAA